jgi:Winged helix DNA-binding domain
VIPTPVTWERTRAFRLARMHVSDPLGPRSLRRVVRDLGGVHAQVASAGELQCAVRATGLALGAPERALWRNRTLVKTWAMRGTLHWIDAEDFPVWAAAFATRRHWRRPVWLRAFNVTVEDILNAVEAVADALDGRCLTRAVLADEVHRRLRSDAVDERIRSGWGEVLKIVAIHGLLCFGPSEGRNVTFVRPDQWVPGWHTVETDHAIAVVCRRYLASHGPATREEFARWWGFFPADARRVLDALGDEIVRVDRAGDKAFALRADVGALQRAREDDEVRLLGMFDPYTLAGLPHDAVVPKSHKSAVYRAGAWVSQVVLEGGRVVGVWTHERRGKGVEVEARLFAKMAGARERIGEALGRLDPFVGELLRLTVL